MSKKIAPKVPLPVHVPKEDTTIYVYVQTKNFHFAPEVFKHEYKYVKELIVANKPDK